MKKWQFVVCLLLAFALGASVGVGGTGFVLQNRLKNFLQGEGPPHVRMLRFVCSRLDLNDAQRKEIEDIFSRQSAVWAVFHEQFAPKMRGQYSDTLDNIKNVLGVDQREKFDALLAEIRRRIPFPPPPPFDGPPPGAMLSERFVLERLDLDEAQLRRVRPIVAEFLEVLTSQLPADPAACPPAQAPQTVSVNSARTAAEEKLKGVLTPPQLETFRQLTMCPPHDAIAHWPSRQGGGPGMPPPEFGEHP